MVYAIICTLETEAEESCIFYTKLVYIAISWLVKESYIDCLCFKNKQNKPSHVSSDPNENASNDVIFELTPRSTRVQLVQC